MKMLGKFFLGIKSFMYRPRRAFYYSQFGTATSSRFKLKSQVWSNNMTQ